MSESGFSATLEGDSLGSFAGVEDLAIGDLSLAFDQISVLDGYRTGTASFTNGSAAVSGTDTVWTAAMVGRYIRKDSDGTLYRISARSSNTAITLASNYAGVTGSGAYTIFSDRIVENTPLSVMDAPITVTFAWNKTLFDTLTDAVLAQTQDEFTLTDGETSVLVGDGYVESVTDKNLSTSGHTTFSAVFRPVTVWTFTPAA